MRTGLITFHFAHHYGAQLQALATMKAIQGLGHDCQIIDYRLPHTTRTNQLFKKSRAVRDMASDAHTALHYSAFQRRFQRFEAFVAEEMSLSSQRYTAFAQLREAPPAYDVYVAGSDQIWNPYIFQNKQFDPAFLLDFVREGRRISYAPSLGVPQLPEDKAAELETALDGAIDDYSAQMEQALAGSGGTGSANYAVVTLSAGQVLEMDIGCEVMLRVGSASCDSPSSPGLIDSTGGTTLDDGGSLAVNHLYMATIEGRSVTADSDTVKVLVRGGYTIR